MSDDLTLDEVKKMLSEAEKISLRDALVFKLMAGYGLSVGEIVGTPARRWDEATRKWFAMEPSGGRSFALGANLTSRGSVTLRDGSSSGP